MTGTIITILLIVLMLALFTAPFEALEWWVDWFEDDPSIAKILPPAPKNEDAPYYLVYLTGIGSTEPNKHAWRELQLFERLKKSLPNAIIVDNIFPYSMNNVALTGNRLFSWLWKFAHQTRSSSFVTPAGIMINFRNMTQVGVSVDHRYGPIYDRGSANLVRRALENHGYPFESNIPVYLLGNSGGAQIAIGAVPYLKQHLNGPIYVISIGGVFGSDRGHIQSTHFYHLVGKRDNIERLGRILFPRRWPFWRRSHWNQALNNGKVTIIPVHARAHTGRNSYLDPKRGANDSQSYLDETVAVITRVIADRSNL
jgi:hypothetical protein